MIRVIHLLQDFGSATMLRVIHAEHVVAIIEQIHGHELKHSGYRKVHHKTNCTAILCLLFSLQLSAPQIPRPQLKPIVNFFFPREDTNRP